jgi:2-dehydropantoate 2-reductase
VKEIKSISIVGLGAIGAVYASKLYDMEPECIKVIANKERIKRYSKNGFSINGKEYNFNYITPEEETEPADLVLVSVKYHHLNQAIKDMRNHVGTDTIILSLMNGISSEEIIGKEYGMDKMLYGMCVAIDALRDDTNITYTNIGKIFFGEGTNDLQSSKVKALKKLLENANIPYEVPQDIMRSLWWKFMINVGINQVSALLKAPYGVFQEIKESHELMESAMKEVIELSQKVGVNLNEDDIEEFDKVLKTLSPKGKTSMHQDIEAGRKTEVEMFAGTVCELGRKYDIDTPVNQFLLKAIHTLEKMEK